MSADASGQDDPPPPVRFEFDTQFFDQLARLVPSAPIRAVLVERAIVRSLRQDLAARRRGEAGAVLLEEGFGLLFTEALNPDVPELLVVFEYEPLDHPTAVTFHRVLLAPKPESSDELEDGPAT